MWGKPAAKILMLHTTTSEKVLIPLLQFDQLDDLSSLQDVIKVTTPPVSVPVFWTLL